MPNLLRSKDGKPRILKRWPGCKYFHVAHRFIFRFNFIRFTFNCLRFRSLDAESKGKL